MANAFERKLFISKFSKLFRCNQLNSTLYRNFFSRSGIYSKLYNSKVRLFAFSGVFIAGVGTACYFTNTKFENVKSKRPFLVSAASKEGESVEVKTDLSVKQKMFNEYASYEFSGKIIMSPRDFLDSLNHNKERQEGSTKTSRKILNEKDVNSILKSNQRLPQNKEDFFTHMDENGIITYPEYLFLLTLLTKSSHGLHVAFRMLDLDGNETLGKTEFQELEKMLNKKSSGKSLSRNRRISSANWIKRVRAKDPDFFKSEVELPSTSLLIHFFGNSGKGQLTFTDMLHFTRNLQREFWKKEFLAHSENKNVINGEQFGKLLLQSTHLNDKDIKEYVQRLKSRQGTEVNVSLQDYVKFGRFLNNLDDFSISLKIYNVANQPVTQDEFKRAARISTGEVLDDHMVNTIFLLFDIDGDGKLSQKEFLGLMKDRVSKRFANRDDNIGIWNGFVSCVKEELT